MDDADIGQLREQLDRDRALASHVARCCPVTTPADGRCLDCGELIEPARIRVLGATERCADCAQCMERDPRRRHG